MMRYSTKPIILIAVLATVLLVTHFTDSSPLPKVSRLPGVHRTASTSIDEQILSEPQQLEWQKLTHEPRCRSLPGAEDVLVVMRTGSTEIKDKLPIHFNTTFRCYPDTLLFSDYAETFQGHEVHDALARIPEHIKSTNEDFELYRRLRESGRSVLDQTELSGPESPDSGTVGKVENKGWKLDKWKFLPMMADVLEKRPDKKFYVFVEPDTYLVWTNLLQWLATVDPSEPRYFGSETMIGEDLFAHGGSAFVLTNSALKKGVDSYLSRTDYWDAMTNWHWAGDCMVGKALSEVGVGLTFSWPMFQGGNPAHLDWADTKGPFKLWCSPVMSYHHLTSREVEGLWNFEQRWIGDHSAGTRAQETVLSNPQDGIIRHRDTFRDHVVRSLRARQRDWSNNSPDLVADSEGASMSSCRAMCEADALCVQYSLGPRGCSLGRRFEAGQPTQGSQSGWLMERVDAWTEDLNSCDNIQDWVVR